MLKTSNVKSSRGRYGFVRFGWSALHLAALIRGAEVDYFPPESPELKTFSYVDPDLYPSLTGRVLDLADINISHLEYKSTLVSRNVWNWILTTARSDIPEPWRIVMSSRSWTALLAAFGDWIRNEGIELNSPSYRASDLRSVTQFGYWLFRHGQWSSQPPIAAIWWGLALIGAAWKTQLHCGRCAICFRQSRSGEAHCDFHSQSSSIELPRSLLYQRYRCGRQARELAMKDPQIAQLLLGSPIQRSLDKYLTLSDMLFPFDAEDDKSDEHNMLIQQLNTSPRVVALASVGNYQKMSYSILIENLRNAIDPNNWSNDLWDFKVLQAELWLELEEKVSPSTRGKGKKTMVKVSRAIELAGQGVSKRQIATALAVSPSAVSKWIKRYPELSFAFNNAT